MTLLKDFKAFLMRGNVAELAVAVVIGAAFGAVVTSLVEDILTPIVAAIAGEPDFSGLAFTINDSRFGYGSFVNALITFVSVAAAVFFFVVVPLNKLLARRTSAADPDAPTKECPECLSEIPKHAKRCAFCTSELAA